MYVKYYCCDFWELRSLLWSDAVWTMDQIANNNKEKEFMDYLEEIYYPDEENPPTLTSVNDFIRFDWETIFQDLGIENPYKEDEEK